MNNFESTIVSLVFAVMCTMLGWSIGKLSSRTVEVVRTEYLIVPKPIIKYKTKIVTVKEREVLVERAFKAAYCSATTVGLIFGTDGNSKATFGAQVSTDINQDVSIGAQVLNNGTFLGILGFKF